MEADSGLKGQELNRKWLHAAHGRKPNTNRKLLLNFANARLHTEQYNLKVRYNKTSYITFFNLRVRSASWNKDVLHRKLRKMINGSNLNL